MAEENIPDFVHRAQEKKLLAEAAAFEAEAAETLERVRHAKIEADAIELDWKVKLESHLLTINSDHYHRILRFSKEVNEASVKEAIETMAKWDRLDGDNPQPMTIVFTSPGGQVFSGLSLFDFILEMRGKGHEVTTVARGYAASMAGILLQAGSVRKMGKESYLMLHEISTIAMGKAFEIQDEADFLERAMDRVYDIFVERSEGKITKARLKRLVERRDFWVSSDDALKYGFVDEVEA